MIDTTTHAAFTLAMLCIFAVGAYCAHKLHDGHPCWVRLIVMGPATIGIFAPVMVMMGIYAPRLFDVLFSSSSLMLYALAASQFSKKPWLEIRTNTDVTD